MAMRMKGPTVDELVGFARAMRRDGSAGRARPRREAAARYLRHRRRRPWHVQHFNVGGVRSGWRRAFTWPSTATVRYQRSCGSADMLEALGVEIALAPADAARAIREVGIGFLFAPAVHTAMRHAQPVRADLKMRTVFNLLGPLTNPAGANARWWAHPRRKRPNCWPERWPSSACARLRGARLRRSGRSHHHRSHPGFEIRKGK